ncbi:MAG: hypothetical protein CL787_03730 [Chloroflexi bacterium]|nr:hypothetical protein [Chloroflexota bacterium]
MSQDNEHPSSPSSRVVDRKKPKIFYGWYIVLAAAAINVYGAGVWFYGFPIFYKVLIDEFGWARATGALVVSLSRVEGGLEAPIVGWFVDKFGPRAMAVIGAIIFGIGYLLMSLVSDFSVGPIQISALVVFILLYAGIMSIGYNTGFSHASMAAVNGWFIKKRSRAFAIFSLGAGASGITVFVLGLAMQNFGWRSAAIMAGIGIFIFVIPMSLLLRHKPEEYGYLPDGEDPNRIVDSNDIQLEDVNNANSISTDTTNYDYSVKEALVTSAFWMLLLGSAARSLTMTSVVVHQVAYLTDIGMPISQASAALGGMVFASLIGRFGFGILGDYIDKRYLLIATYMLQSVGIFVLDSVQNMNQVWTFVVIYGIAYGGAIPLYFAIVGDYFGRTNYATIRGFQQFFTIPAVVFGPIYAGIVFDVSGDYSFAFMSFIGTLIVGMVFVFLARNPLSKQANI